MRVMDSARQLRYELHGLWDRHRRAPDYFVKLAAFDKIHAEVAATIALAHFMNGNDKWMVEAGSPNSLLRLGFTKNSLPAGTELVIEGYQAKDRGNLAVGKNITFADGRRMFLGGSANEVNDADAGKKK